MITEEDLAEANMPGMTPGQRFRFIEQLAAKRLANVRDHEGDPIYDDYDYMSSVLVAARFCGIDELAHWEMPDHSNASADECRNFRAQENCVSQRILFEQYSQAALDSNTVALDAKTKELIRFHLVQVRTIIDEQRDIPDWKKEDLYAAIAALEREIDKARSRLTAVLDVIGKTVGIERVEKIMGAVVKVVGIFQDAKTAEKEQLKLMPPPPKPKQIEPPRDKLPPPLPKKISFDKDLAACRT